MFTGHALATKVAARHIDFWFFDESPWDCVVLHTFGSPMYIQCVIELDLNVALIRSNSVDQGLVAGECNYYRGLFSWGPSSDGRSLRSRQSA